MHLFHLVISLYAHLTLYFVESGFCHAFVAVLTVMLPVRTAYE